MHYYYKWSCIINSENHIKNWSSSGRKDESYISPESSRIRTHSETFNAAGKHARENKFCKFNSPPKIRSTGGIKFSWRGRRGGGWTLFVDGVAENTRSEISLAALEGSPDWLGQINCCLLAVHPVHRDRACWSTQVRRATWPELACNTDLRILPAKRPYSAQDSSGYITSRNDIPLLSLVTPLPTPLPRRTGTPGIYLFPSFGNSTLRNYRICPLFFCHPVTCRHIFWRRHSPDLLEYPATSSRVYVWVTHRQHSDFSRFFADLERSTGLGIMEEKTLLYGVCWNNCRLVSLRRDQKAVYCAFIFRLRWYSLYYEQYELLIKMVTMIIDIVRSSEISSALVFCFLNLTLVASSVSFKLHRCEII